MSHAPAAPTSSQPSHPLISSQIDGVRRLLPNGKQRHARWRAKLLNARATYTG